MKSLVVIYWTRVALGIIAATISVLVVMTQNAFDFSTFTTSFTIALLIYLVSYYVFKAKFLNKVEKQSKILTMGIFIYFMAWAAFFILFYTIIEGPALVA
jgi:hypothetical protein